ncbi:hypothetical protein HGG70_07360 [Rhodobacteraceae bacterium R_SAG4]|nr:hypothetical protein [Rhodobacteraceae bacterium R_SAG4]
MTTLAQIRDQAKAKRLADAQQAAREKAEAEMIGRAIVQKMSTLSGASLKLHALMKSVDEIIKVVDEGSNNELTLDAAKTIDLTLGEVLRELPDGLETVSGFISAEGEESDECDCGLCQSAAVILSGVSPEAFFAELTKAA